MSITATHATLPRTPEQGGRMRSLMLVCFVLVGCAMARRTSAQDRMPPIPADKMTDAQRKAVAEFKTARSADLSGPFVPLLRSPEVMTRARAMGDYLRFKSSLPPRLSEFTILLAARRWTQQYEWNVHQPLALQAGLNPDIARAVADGRRPDRLAADEDALYTLVDELQRNQSVSDPTYARAIAAFGEAGVIDVLGITGYYTMLAMVMNTTRTALPDGMHPSLQPFPR
jgi:4-carboxymuconolactone decarboxylase